MTLSSISPTRKALWLLAIVSLTMFFVSGRWHRSKAIDGDVISYYSYLPAVIVHGDITMEYSVGDDFYSDKVWGVIWKDHSGPVQKYTMGLSWLYAPFFMLAHGSAYLLGYPADGYSAPYSFWLQLSALCYLLAGMHWLSKVLLRYFSENISALCLLVLALGTNLYYYSQGQAAMPHVYMFALLSGLMWATIRFFESPDWKKGLLIGAICSVFTLVRPNHLLFWLIPVLYGIVDRQSWAARRAFWATHWPKMLAWPLIQALVWVPQFIYWRILTDHWIYYSYGDEHFFWASPMIGKVLLSFRNGWLIYTPVMALALAGLVGLRRYAREFSFLIPLILVPAAYVISCWWCWWYGGSFGSRVFVDLYPLLALGLGAALTRIAAIPMKKGLRWAALGILGMFVLLNLFQTLQYTRGIIHYDSMTASAYFHVFGRERKPKDLPQYLETPDYEAAKRGER